MTCLPITCRRRDVLRLGVAAVVLPFTPISKSANLHSYSDPDDDTILCPEQLDSAIDFAQWNLAANVSNARRHGTPWPWPVETCDWHDKLVIIAQHPSADALDPIAEEVLAEVAFTGLPIVGAYRTPCGRVACLMLLGSRRLFAERTLLAERQGGAP